jgi:transposase InsO family protein
MDLWIYRHGVKIDFSRSGKPTDNALRYTNFNWHERSGRPIILQAIDQGFR